MRSRTVVFGLFLACCLIGALPVQAQVKNVETFDREIELVHSDKGLFVSFSCPEVFSEWVRKRLSSGFKIPLLVQVQLKERGNQTPVAQGMLHHTITYHLWDEVFAVRIEGFGGRTDLKIKTMDELVQRFGSVQDLSLFGQVDLDPEKQYRVVARVVVNPASPEIRRKVREYVANPDGHRAYGTTPFFSRFSGIFVNEKDLQADAVLTYRSPWRLPSPPKAKKDGP